MIKLIKKGVLGLIQVAALSAPLFAVAGANAEADETKRAQEIGKGAFKALESTGLKTDVQTAGDVITIIQDVVGWIQVFFYVAATLMVVLAAWDYLNSGGNEEKVQSAKNKLIYAIVAVIIAVIAGGVVRLVFNFVDTGTDIGPTA
tara:strand:- start:304 stop:741 length:438 start_codon:yes stop_codon:yes gene_type:complete